MMQNIKKLEMQTPNKVDENIENILKLFPNVATEKEGKKVVDFDMLRQMLSDKIVEGDEERYRLDWVGKKASLLKANSSINKTLRPCKEESVDFDNTQNLYIEGDNFEVLKLLSESYLNKIKMIYIDPPYNTGKDFVYRDNFTQSKVDFEDAIGVRDEEGNKLFKNTDSNGRFHSDWLSMMYERLLVARDLLKEDGVIFISIDDNEVHNLRKICDEVFGEGNFIASIVRNTNSSKNQSLFVSVSHEYCLIYSKNIEALKEKHKENKWSVPKNNTDEYLKKIAQLQKEGLDNDKITEELKTLTKYPRFIDFTNYWYFDENGLYMKDNLGGVPNGNKTPIINPLTNQQDPLPPGGFRFSAEKMNELINKNKIHFHIDGSLPRLKRYLHENEEQRPKSIMSDDQRPDYSMMTQFETPFDNPKQLSFMTRIVSLADKDSIVLDFFSGSSTTAHAVMQLNAEDGGNRKFIMVQLPELINENSGDKKSKFNNICELAKERIRRAGIKITQEIASAKPRNDGSLDIGFRVLKIDTTNFKDVYYHPNNLTQKDIFDFQTNIKEERTDLDLLFQIMLDLGIELSLKITHQTVDGTKLYMLENNELIACLEDAISQAAIQEIKKHKPYQVVLKDGCFADDNDKINALQELSNITTVSVI